MSIFSAYTKMPKKETLILQYRYLKKRRKKTLQFRCSPFCFQNISNSFISILTTIYRAGWYPKSPSCLFQLLFLSNKIRFLHCSWHNPLLIKNVICHNRSIRKRHCAPSVSLSHMQTPKGIQFQFSYLWQHHARWHIQLTLSRPQKEKTELNQ